MTKKLLFPGLAGLIALLIGVSSAAAEGCPAKTVAEEGGTHWCYSAGKLGHVHLWKPGRYDRDRAVTVVYVHGYNLGDDGCPNADYVDCAWEKHHLAKQFEASGLDALFVAVEAPISDGQRAKWKLDALLETVRRKGGIRPPLPVVAMGHSGGAFTIERFLDDGRLRHVILLDGGYKQTPKKITAWYGADKDRRLTLVGAEGTYWSSAALGKTLKCERDDDFAAPYSEALKTERCVAMIDKEVGHMDVVRAGRVIPLVLSRVLQPPPPKAKSNPRSKARHRKRR